MGMPLMFGLSAEGVTQFAIKCLAVGGAFLAGYTLLGVIVFVLDRWLFNKKILPAMKRAARTIGGVAAAVFAALVLFGSGGDGLFGGGGAGSGTSDGTTNAAHPNSTNVPPPQPPPVTPADVPDTNTIVRVTILGGTDVKAERFYQIDDDATPRTFDEVKRLISSRKSDATKKLTLVLQFPDRNTPARDHPAVIQLERWATEQAGLGVFQPAKK